MRIKLSHPSQRVVGVIVRKAMNDQIRRLAEASRKLYTHLLDESGEGCHSYYEAGGRIMDEVTGLISEIKPKAWSGNWPIEPGYYWAYGQYKSLLKAGGYPRDIMLVKVRKVSNGIMYVGDGQFLYPEEMDLFWLPATPPRGPQ